MSLDPPDLEGDRGLLLGDGLFETILAVNGVLEHVDAHVQRMIRGCAVIGLDPPDVEVAREAAEAALGAAGLIWGRAAVRLTLSAGGGRGLDRPPGQSSRLIASASVAPQPPLGVRLATVPLRRNETSPVSRLKTLSYLDNVLARRQARDAGAEDALMLNTAGHVACAAAANLFWIAGERLYTPALDCGVLDGIMRARVMASAHELGAPVQAVRVGMEALELADAMFLTNSLTGVCPVLSLDGREVGTHRFVDALSRSGR
jgi:branched-chain amino acid aminotransferase/4-amino-4-deoxychorismate lyase